MEIYTTQSARKHGFSDEEIVYAWEHAVEYRRAKGEKQPPHYLAVGVLPDGRTAELVAYSTGLDWVVFHCMSPVSKGFMHEWKSVDKNGGR